MKTPSLPFVLAFVILTTGVWAEDPPPGNALTLFNAYLARAAATTIEYRADLQPGGDPRRMAPGRLFGISPLLGPFTYRPKTYGELTPAERGALIHNPKFRSFLIATRQPGAPLKITLPAEEMLRSRPAVITLSAPPDVP